MVVDGLMPLEMRHRWTKRATRYHIKNEERKLPQRRAMMKNKIRNDKMLGNSWSISSGLIFEKMAIEKSVDRVVVIIPSFLARCL